MFINNMTKRKGFTLIEFMMSLPIILLFTVLIAATFTLTAKLQDEIESRLSIELIKEECLTKLLSGVKSDELINTAENNVIKIIRQDEGDHHVEFYYKSFSGEEKKSVIYAETE